MLPRKSISLYAILLVVLSLANSRPTQAQVFDLDKDRVQLVEMAGLWRFHTGDDPHWADPSFDDSGWSLLRADESWSDQGYQGYGGMAWYRCVVLLPSKHGELAIDIPALITSYQVFANGRLIGKEGGDAAA